HLLSALVPVDRVGVPDLPEGFVIATLHKNLGVVEVDRGGWCCHGVYLRLESRFRMLLGSGSCAERPFAPDSGFRSGGLKMGRAADFRGGCPARSPRSAVRFLGPARGVRRGRAISPRRWPGADRVGWRVRPSLPVPLALRR